MSPYFDAPCSVYKLCYLLCGADDGDIVRQKKPILGRLTSGNLHRLTLGREACESPTLPARLLPTMSRGHLPNDRDLVAGLGLFL